jgi:hypothetical protein
MCKYFFYSRKFLSSIFSIGTSCHTETCFSWRTVEPLKEFTFDGFKMVVATSTYFVLAGGIEMRNAQNQNLFINVQSAGTQYYDLGYLTLPVVDNLSHKCFK